MKKFLTISFSLLLVLTIVQESWGQTASKYHVGQITGIGPQVWPSTKHCRQVLLYVS
jgi:hypothetical protein